jgi:hypothetical protein
MEVPCMDTKTVLKLASGHLTQLGGHTSDAFAIAKPSSFATVASLSKVISKLSPLVGNLIEFSTVEFLNTFDDFKAFGTWRRQDPGFPDVVFEGTVNPTPGFEIKAWFPLATEITGRFKDSQKHFIRDQTYVAILAWLPEYIIYGKPHIIDVVVVAGASVAKARDDHYHNPPDYLVVEPEDTTQRTINLRQTNTNGYKFQGTTSELKAAQKLVDSWGEDTLVYKSSAEYQIQMRQLLEKYKYRLDTNFAKIDRIEHSAIEEFKSRVLKTTYKGMPIRKWSRLLFRGDEKDIAAAFATNLSTSESEDS